MSATVRTPNIRKGSLRVAGSLRGRPDHRLEPRRFRVTRQPHHREATSRLVVNAGIGPGCDGPPKAALRRRFRARRRALSATLHARHAEALARALLPRLSAADVVAIYLRQDGEIDPAPLRRMGLDRGVAFALPVLAEDGLRFARYRAGRASAPRPHGLLEPANPVAARPTLVLAPVVAFDQRGYRLGMGGGHYDRYFADSATSHGSTGKHAAS